MNTTSKPSLPLDDASTKALIAAAKSFYQPKLDKLTAEVAELRAENERLRIAIEVAYTECQYGSFIYATARLREALGIKDEPS